MAVKFIDNSAEYKEAMASRIEVALEAIAIAVQAYASIACPVDTGRLRASITYAIKKDEGKKFQYRDRHGHQYDDQVGIGADENTAYIGTNVEYAPIIELGSSKRAPRPFLKPAVVDHVEEYKKIAKKYLRDES